MTWNPEKIRSLRLRLGWSPSELARKIGCESQRVIRWELGQDIPFELETQALEFYEHQADFNADQIFMSALAEVYMDECQVDQTPLAEVKKRFSHNN